MEAGAVVFIGRRPAALYIAKAVTELSTNERVRLVAREQFIVKAVRLVKAGGYTYNIFIDEEEFSTDTGKRLIPKTEIELVKKER